MRPGHLTSPVSSACLIAFLFFETTDLNNLSIVFFVFLNRLPTGENNFFRKLVQCANNDETGTTTVEEDNVGQFHTKRKKEKKRAKLPFEYEQKN